MEQKISEAGQLPDWTSGRRWLIENYENYHTRFVTALDFWSRTNDVYMVNLKLWQAMNRVIKLIKHRKPVTKIDNYLETVKKWEAYNNEHKIPDKKALLEFSDFLDKALYELRLVYDEETERKVLKAYWRGQQL